MNADIRGPVLTDEEKKKKKIKKIIFIILFVVLNGVVLFFTARADFSKKAPDTMPQFTFINILYLLGALVCVVIVLMCETVKYLLMMKHLGEKPSFRVAFETAALGKYYDSITPSGAGGQPFQIWHLHSNGYSDGASSAMPLGGFVTMQFGFVFLCLLSFIFGAKYINVVGIQILSYVGAFTYTIVPVLIVLSAVKPSAAVALVSFFVKIGAKLRLIKNKDETMKNVNEKIADYSKSLRTIAKSKLLLFELMALSVLFQAAVCSIPFFVIGLFGGKIGFFASLCMTVYVYASVTIVPTPGNSGAAEGSFYLLFEQLDTAGLFWAMLVWRVLCYYSFILTGVIIYGKNALLKIIKRKKKDAA